MKKILVSELKPGMRLAKDVLLKDGRLLLLANFVIKQRYITKLTLLGIDYVYIDENEEVPHEEIKEEKVYSEAFNSIKSVLTSVRDGKNVDVPLVKNTVNEIVHKVINNELVFMQLTGIRDIDNDTFLHSVDVCIYSVITGKIIGLSINDLTDLGISALLHDIGKCKIPLEILTKPDKLTNEEFQVMRLHTKYGYEILCNTPGLNKRIANVAWQHHERWDGNGYPSGLKNTQIDTFSRIVTAADIYDALTANRVYRRRCMPHEAAEYVMKNSSIFIDPEIANIFINNISVYPEGTVVLLNTGEVARVVECRSKNSIKPIVEVITRKEGPPVLTPYSLDLANNTGTSIIDILS
mgnify:CR=1 FL=1